MRESKTSDLGNTVNVYKMANRSYAMPVKTAIALLFVGILFVTACTPVSLSRATEDYNAEVAVAWFDLSLKLAGETDGYTPPVASRAFGYLGVTLYESVRPGMLNYRSMAGQLNGLKGLPSPQWFVSYHWPSAANAALARITRKLFPTASAENLSAIGMLEERYSQRFMAEVDSITYTRSVQWGHSIADAIYRWSRDDGGHSSYVHRPAKDYVAPIGIGLWVSTSSKFAGAMQPHWGDNRPFVLKDGKQCSAPEPLVYAEEQGSDFYAEALEVYEAVKENNPEQKAIASFWADDTGHWISILNQVIAVEELPLSQAAESYAKVGIALADSFITCWNTKFIYNVVRPITYIQANIDADWNTLVLHDSVTEPLETPLSPEYTSDYAVQSAAAAALLTNLFGLNYGFVDHTNESFGLPSRTFESFATAAEEAALAQLYRGLHYRFAIEEGLVQGACVAAHVLQLKFGPQ